MEFKLSILIGVVLVGVALVRLLRVGRRPAGYPPGPPTIPVLGNIHLMPARDAHKQFQKWAQEYGPIYSLILGTKTMIVLSSDEVVKELLDKRSAIYSDRMDMYIGMELCSDNLRMLMMRYGPQWRMIRRMIHNMLNVQQAVSYVPYQILENRQMLNDLLVKPDNFLEHIRRYSNSLTTSIVFGWRAPTYQNEDVQQLFDGFSEFSLMNQTGTAALLDFFPVLRVLPDWVLPTQKRAKQLHKEEKRLYLRHWLNCKAAVRAGTAKPCFCVNLAKAQEAEGFNDDLACYISGTMLEAGSDTTSCTLYGFVQAMLLHPDVQRKAQAQIDSVVGTSRLPTMDDEPNLQYIRGCVKESLRWMPTALLGGVPHAVTKDDEYGGYHIPAGAGILHNVYTIHNDEARYPNPRVFDPDRFKDDFLNAADAAVSSDATARDHFAFGAGRRICQGMHVAERSLFLGMARILWGFNILPALDENGKEIWPDSNELTQGFVCMPVPYKARIVPRSPEHAALIKEEWRKAKEECLDPKDLQWKISPQDAS